MSYILVIIACIIGSAFFSGAETAFVSCNRIRIRHLAKGRDRKAQIVEKLLVKPERILATTLVGTNIFIVLGVVMAAAYAGILLHNYEGLSGIVATVVMTPVILVFSEAIPKAYFYRYADTITLRIGGLLRFFFYLFSPLVILSTFLPRRLMGLMGDTTPKNPFVTREELRLLMWESGRLGVLEKHEQDMIHHIFEFRETMVKSVMVPLVAVDAIEVGEKVASALKVIDERGHSRLPIYDERVDNIIAYVSVGELLGKSPSGPIKNLMNPVLIVPETKSIADLLLDLKARGEHLAVVVDEYGGVSGIVTLEDLIEEIVGEIEDEHDEPEVELPGGEPEGIIIEGSRDLDKLNEELELALPEGDYETIAGFIMSLTGRIPSMGEKIRHSSATFEILESTDRAIQKIKVIVDRK
ncbi:MAG: hemolysin family protein [Thermodesulfobacteriota bacterium]